MTPFNESIVEQAALTWLAELNYTILYGPDIAPGEPAAARADYRDVILLAHLRAALARINPHLPADAIDEAVRKVQRSGSGSLLANNHAFHRLLTEGIDLTYRPDSPLQVGEGPGVRPCIPKPGSSTSPIRPTINFSPSTNSPSKIPTASPAPPRNAAPTSCS